MKVSKRKDTQTLWPALTDDSQLSEDLEVEAGKMKGRLVNKVVINLGQKKVSKETSNTERVGAARMLLKSQWEYIKVEDS